MPSARLHDPRYLKLHLPLNGIAKDMSGNNVPVTAANLTYEKNSRGATVARFNGTTSTIAPSFNIQDTSGIFTIAGRFRLSSITKDQCIMSNWVRSSTNGFMLFFDDVTSASTTDRLVSFFNISDGTNERINGNTILSLNKDYTFAIVCNGAFITQYIDGKLDGTLTLTKTEFYNTTTNFFLGNGRDSDRFWDGLLSDIKIYKGIALSAEEVLELHNQRTLIQTTVQQPFNTLPDITDPSLVGAWLNKATVGGEDYSNNQLTTTIVGSPIREKVGMSFISNGDNISTTNAIAKLPQYSAYTIAMTVTPKVVDATASGLLYCRLTGAAPWQSVLIYSASGSDKVRFQQTDATGSNPVGISSNSALSVGQTYRLAFRWTGSKISMFINGVKQSAEGNIATLYSQNYTYLVIGNSTNTTGANPADATIQDVEVYSEAKSDEWIRQDYAKRFFS